jgi:hypothetical protein
VYRYPVPYRLDEPLIDGLPNFYAVTTSAGLPAARLESGINALAPARTAAGVTRPAILVRSSPHKAGSPETPWSDTFDPDRGHVRYFGDAKPGLGKPATTARGNAMLLEEYRRHHSNERAGRLAAAPILLFRGVTQGARLKGQVEFAGVALIERAEIVMHIDCPSGRAFQNVHFDFAVVSLARERDAIDWAWIDLRRRPNADLAEAARLAPTAWRRWIDDGAQATVFQLSCRAHVTALGLIAFLPSDDSYTTIRQAPRHGPANARSAAPPGLPEASEFYALSTSTF